MDHVCQERFEGKSGRSDQPGAWQGHGEKASQMIFLMAAEGNGLFRLVMSRALGKSSVVAASYPSVNSKL